MTWTTSIEEVAGQRLHVSTAGRGQQLVVLHHEIGSPADMRAYDLLAEHYQVLIPHHPGFGRSERLNQLASVRDLAVLYQGLIAKIDLRNLHLLGLGFGGWIAAEMATMAPRDVKRLVLAAPMGIKPPEGDIFDQAIVHYIDYVRTGFHDQAAFDRQFGADPPIEQIEEWDLCREMSFRLAWKPYMYNQTLPFLLPVVQAPALVLWGAEDRIVPVSAAGVWTSALPNARSTIIPSCGHFIDMERPDELVRAVRDFVG